VPPSSTGTSFMPRFSCSPTVLSLLSPLVFLFTQNHTVSQSQSTWFLRPSIEWLEICLFDMSPPVMFSFAPHILPSWWRKKFHTSPGYEFFFPTRLLGTPLLQGWRSLRRGAPILSVAPVFKVLGDLRTCCRLSLTR